MTGTCIPTPDDVTPQWLTQLLRSHGYETLVTDVSTKQIGTGQVGATYRFTLNQNGNGPASVVGKFPSNDPLSKATGKSHLTYIRESRFYQLFAGKKPMPVPEHLFIAFDDDSHDFALIMHDLPHHDVGNQLSFPTYDEAMRAMGAAAAIHAAWWGDPMLDTLDWLNGSKAVPPPLDVEALFTMFWPAFCDRYGERVSADMKRVGDAYLGQVNAWSNASAGPRCLTHNDFRPDNMMFDLSNPRQPIVIVDWQTVGVGNGAGDIAYFMGTALDPAMRKSEEAKLFAHYLEKLIERGVPQRDTEDLWDVYRASAFSGFLMGVTASIVVQQTERGDAMFLAMAERSAAMVIDHAEIALPA
jgi:Phosphotransferase enzyme family